MTADTALADARTEARRHFRHGMELVVAGQVDEGVAELEEAYNILPHPNVLYNIGRAYAEVGRYDEARDYFDRYLESDPPDREEVRAIVAAIDARVAARATAQTETTASEGSDSATAATGEGAGVAATAEQLATIDSAIEQVSGLCALTASESLCDRERQLREVRARLAAEAAAGSSDTSVAGAGTGDEAVGGAVDAGGGITVAASTSGEAAYVERVDAAARQRSSPLDAPASTTIITRQDIRMSGVTQIGEVLRRAAGVHVVNPSPVSSNVAIRGFNRLLSPRVLMLINGRTTYFDPLGTPFWDSQAIQIEDIERIEIIRGPASVLYGANGFSGIINIVTRAPGDDPGTDVTVGVGNAGQARGHLTTSGRRGDLSWRVTGAYQQLDRYARLYDNARVDESLSIHDNARAYQSSIARIHMRYRASDDVALTFESGVNYIGAFNFYATGAFLDFYARGPVSYASLAVNSPHFRARTFVNRANFDVDMTDSSINAGSYTNNTFDVEAELTEQFHFGLDHDLHLGLNYRMKEVDWTFLGPRPYTEHHGALFFEDTMRYGDKLRIVVAARVDRHPLLQPNFVASPRGAIIYRPTEGQSIRLTAGSAFRTPSMMDTYVDLQLPTPVSSVSGAGIGSDVARRRLGRPAVNPERMVSVELGYQNQESDYFAFDVSAYYNRVRDIIGFEDSTRFLRLADYGANSDPMHPNPYAREAGFDPTRNSFVAGVVGLQNEPEHYQVLGAEVGVRTFPIDGLDVYANYSANYVMVDHSPDGQTVDTRSPQHMVNVGAQYRSPIGLDVSADYNYTAATQWPELATSLAGLERRHLDLPSFQLLNARLAYRIPGDRVTFAVSGQNLNMQHRRQHPFGQPIDTRVMGTVTAHF